MKKLRRNVPRKRETAPKKTGVAKSPRSAERAGEEAPSAAGQKAIPIVGIGASAGGLEAFTQLLHALPANTGMAYVLVQHLEPRHESMLTKLLTHATAMPVHEVREGMRIEPNHVYVIPANADLSLMDGLLHVVGRRAPAGRHLPIDYFMRSLAETRKSQAIGVILSGTASDGTAGLQAIKVEGGITFAQEPGSAKYDGMPRNAIAAGCVDFVLPPERIAAELARIASHPFVAKPLPEAIEALPAKEEDWTHLFRLLRTASGVDFTFYKRSTIRRRLARRMALHKLESIGEYLTFAEHHREEIDALFREVLIPVTGFFRDPEVFAALGEKIFPQILAAKRPGDSVRMWVPGCSTGEEAYSIAICLLEYLGDRASGMSIQIFGTDVSDVAIDKARGGGYSELEMRDVSPERRRRFFNQVDGNYVINVAVRELCVFARQDVIKDPPFSKLELLSCRNVLIYLEPVLQERVLSLFHYALKDSGVLMLGKSESLGAFADLFTAIDRRNKFFSKNLAARASIEVAQTPQGTLAPLEKVALEAPPRLDLEREADRIVWERYAHSGIVVNNALQILHFRGDTSPYLQPAPGRATLSLMRMLREELQLELRAAVQEARKTGRSVRRESIPLKHDQQERAVSIEVRPLPVIGADEKCFLILFDEADPRRSQPSKRPAAKPQGRTGWQRERQKLENELARTRAYLQAVIQEQETTNEELKTANEEAMSSMEELQSTNEELETAKEELQSSNEELVTLNDQLQTRNAELTNLSDDLSNVISGVDIPIVILDGELRIRRFNSSAHKLLGMLSGDIGRPIGNLHISMNVPDLKELILSVIAKGEEVAREVQSEVDHWYWLRIRPFRTGEQKIEGVLMSFVDIDELKRNEESLQMERDFIAAILDAAKDLLVVVLDRDGRIVQFNQACQQLTGYTAEEVKGKHLWDFMLLSQEAAAIRETFGQVLAGASSQTESHWIAKDGRRLLIAWSNRPAATGGSVESVIATGVDRTEGAEARQRAQESEATVRALLETAAQAILAIDQQGRIVLANAASERMFGYRRNELIGQTIESLIPERFRERHATYRTKWFSQPANRQMGVGLELAGLRKDGTEFPVEVSLSYIQGGDGVLGVGFVSDISERKKNEQALLDYQTRLQRLTANLITVQEAGNEELARELHDVFSQELAALAMEVSTLQTSRQVAGPLTERLTELGRQIGQLAEHMHGTARRLHPAILKELGLEAALREECDKFSEQTGIPVQLMCEELSSALPDDVSLCLYRIVQESLLNIRKHAKAGESRIALRGVEGGVSLRIEDSGNGFDVAQARKKGGLGLTSMEERVRLVNGKFDIRSQPGQGTTVEVFVPLNEDVT
jgi:PAS domain S-box-containing protein